MRRLVLGVAASVVAVAAWIGPGAAPAGACSCVERDPDAPVVAFVGTATDVVLADFGFRWTIAVDEVLEGEVPADEVAVSIDHDAPPGPDGARAVSSCSVGPGPEVGGRYRFAVAPVDEGPFVVNLCAGAFEAAAGGAPAPPATAATDDDDDPPWGLVVVGGLLALTVVALATLKLSSRVALRSRP